MTIEHAVARLASAVAELWSAVGELTLIVLEDQPGAPGLAAVDDLVEQVSELQGDVAMAMNLLNNHHAVVIGQLDVIGRHLHAAQSRFWMRLNSHESLSALRAATRRAAGRWPAWQGSVEGSASRCLSPLDDAVHAIQTCWQEVIPLLVIDAADRNHRNHTPNRRMS